MVFPCHILNGKHFSVGLSPHPLLIPEARSKRKQIMFVHTWNMLTATFTLTSCCKMSSLFSTGSFFNQWLFISGLVVIFGRSCWLVIKILSLWAKKDESPFLLTLLRALPWTPDQTFDIFLTYFWQVGMSDVWQVANHSGENLVTRRRRTTSWSRRYERESFQ